jgi:hypothetical protein
MTAKAQREEHTAELGKALVADFKERPSNEEIVATGLSSLAVARVTIPSERWPELWPNFADKAEGKELTFTKVHVSKPDIIRQVLGGMYRLAATAPACGRKLPESPRRRSLDSLWVSSENA